MPLRCGCRGDSVLVVLKVGGALDGQGQRELAAALQICQTAGYQVVIVHGGGPEITRRLTAQGIELPFVDGLRVTTQRAVPVVMEALAHCNATLSEDIRQAGFQVCSLTSGDVVIAKDVGTERTGDVAAIDSDCLLAVCHRGEIPILAPYGKDAAGAFYNLNADTVAAHVAVACSADKLVLCTNVAGVFADFKAGVQYYDVTATTLRRALEADELTAGMVPKVQSMLLAAEHGTGEVWVVDGQDGESLRFAIARPTAEFDASRRTFGTCLRAAETYREVVQ